MPASSGAPQPFEQQQRVRPDVAFGMEFRRLPDPFMAATSAAGRPTCRSHPAARSAARAALGEDARQLFTNPLGRNFQDQRMVRAMASNVRIRSRTSSARRNGRAQQPQMIFQKTASGSPMARTTRRSRSARPPT